MSEITDDNFKARFAAARKPVLLVLGAEFCGPSHMLMPVIDEVLDDDDSFNLVEVSVETCPLMTRHYEVKGTPTMIWLDAGEPKGTRVGTMSVEQMREFISEMKSK